MRNRDGNRFSRWSPVAVFGQCEFTGARCFLGDTFPAERVGESVYGEFVAGEFGVLPRADAVVTVEHDNVYDGDSSESNGARADCAE